MHIYEPDDEVKMYFVIYDDGNHQRIQGWTDDKDLVKAYMDFHKCKYYKLKTIIKPMREVVEILNENSNDEIDLYMMTIRADKNHKRGHESKQVAAPMTNTEATFIREEINTFMASRVNYMYMHTAFHYFKNKYQKALKGILFDKVMYKVLLEKNSKELENIQMDELSVLARSFPDHFN